MPNEFAGDGVEASPHIPCFQEQEFSGACILLHISVVANLPAELFVVDGAANAHAHSVD